ncbi:MAG: alpha/beta hydrolase, partial [Verrucomicrobiales bacterium]
MRLILITLILAPLASVWAERIAIWPDHAPGETVKQEGVALPSRDSDRPPITRVEKITQPTLEAFLPEGGGNGTAVLVLPGGGFGYVVPDLEGSETAAFLNPLGISVFVLSYRTKL